MKIIYLSVSYKESGENLYNDLVNALNEKGHSITIIVPEKLDSSTYLEKVSERRKILHVKAGNWFSTNYIKKGISMLCFSSKMIKGIKMYLYNEKYDLILYATPPITFNNVIKFCKRKYNCESFLMLKDIYPQGAIDLGLLSKTNPITKYFLSQERDLYFFSDKIGCMSKGNQLYIAGNNDIDINKTIIFPNSIKIREYKVVQKADNHTLFVFGGNLGAPQNIDGLLKMIDDLKDYNKAKFIIVGKGKFDYKAKQYARESGNKNFKYYDFLDKVAYDNLLLTADVGLISLDSRFTIPNIPSKLQNYLNMKIPVLAITDTSTDLKDIIKEANCGWWCDSSRLEMVISEIENICNNKKIQIEKGKNGYNYLLQNYKIETSVNVLEEFVGGSNDNISK